MSGPFQMGQFVITSDGSPWKTVSSPAFNVPPAKTPGAVIYAHIYAKSGSLQEVQEILNAHTVEEIKAWASGGHPLLHEACEQFAYDGAQHILQAFFEDPRLKPLFVDRDYVDKHQWIATWRISRLLGMEFYRGKPLPSIVTDIVKEFNIKPQVSYY
jgi:hypothetical protein